MKFSINNWYNLKSLGLNFKLLVKLKIGYYVKSLNKKKKKVKVEISSFFYFLSYCNS